jgi:lactobin A/cerein 7B family class IIb bacteriocin
MKEISQEELRSTDGGVLPLYIIGGIFFLGVSCGLKSTGN